MDDTREMEKICLYSSEVAGRSRPVASRIVFQHTNCGDFDLVVGRLSGTETKNIKFF
ncbi:hypothetical protein RJP21_16910 [Paenibacillus sp. VCA1]|uniref:hypothetical protein n=1 Tax=Paenibacillus sp. VCA1 TaxID=3039148 RepID=UPI002871051F|nr:hypothetical protein [Paenibacillus sp. VCA1]MDR9855299.1 hypothetical protein [Paenibacillus sp. VCA1]